MWVITYNLLGFVFFAVENHHIRSGTKNPAVINLGARHNELSTLSVMEHYTGQLSVPMSERF